MACLWFKYIYRPFCLFINTVADNKKNKTNLTAISFIPSKCLQILENRYKNNKNTFFQKVYDLI